MTTLKSFFTFIIMACFVSTSFAQFSSLNKRIKRIKVSQKAMIRAATPSNGPRKIMTSRDHVWVLPSGQKRGYWSKPKSGEVKKHQQQNFIYEYPVSLNHLKAYGKGPVSYGDPRPPQRILYIGRGAKHHKDGLKKRVVGSSPINKIENTNNVRASTFYYFRKIKLNSFIIAPQANHIIVVDTLYVPASASGKASFTTMGWGRRNYVKIIADVIVYESPILLISTNKDKTDYVFSANKFIFKSPYKNLSSKELNPSPPLFKAETNYSKGHKDPMSKNARILLNRLYVHSMNQILNDLLHKRVSDEERDQLLAEYHGLKDKKVNKTLVDQDNGNIKITFSRLDEKYAKVMNWLYALQMERILTQQLPAEGNSWKRDGLLTNFQTLRKSKIREDILEDDAKTRKLFYNTSTEFDEQYGSNKIEDARDLHGLKILVDGTVDQLPGEKFKYYTLPTKARLLPVDNQNTGEPTTLGTVHYNPTGDSQLELMMEVALQVDLDAKEQVANKLKSYGLELQEGFPFHMAEIEEQVLKVNGRKVGQIIPVGQQNVRFEIELPNDGLSLLQLFKSKIKFKLDYKINNQLKPYSQVIQLKIDPSLLENLDVQQPLESFSVIEKSTMTEILKIASFLDSDTEEREEGALNYVVVSLEFNFEGKKVFRGPYRLSSSNTLASVQVVDFLKHTDNYSIRVTGKAFYENGTRDIKSFETKSQIISIDEDILK